MFKKSATILLMLFFAVAGIFFLLMFFDGGRKINFQQEEKGQSESESFANEIEIVEMSGEVTLENEKNEAFSSEEVFVIENTDKETETAKEENTKVVEEKDAKSELKIKDKLVSWGFTTSSGRKIDTVILHSSFNSLGSDQYSVDKIIDIYKDYEVAAHYIIGRDGNIYQLVKEKDVAYHAGVSEVPDGRNNVNNFSIGIEMVGNYDDGYTSDQYDVVNALIKDINSRYEIKYVLGHDDIAPGRKTDPWNFNWSKLQ